MLQLIANSGIQFYSFDISFNPNERIIPNIGFYEFFDKEKMSITLEYAIYLADQGIFVSKRQLMEDGYLIDGVLNIAAINVKLLNALNEDTEVYSINDVNRSLSYFENQWIPLPYFETNNAGFFQFGPINWCRAKLLPDSNASRGQKKYKIILAFDTITDNEDLITEGPVIQDKSKTYSLCSDLDKILDFTNDRYKCDWVQSYLEKLVGVHSPKKSDEFPTTKYIAYYIYLIRFLAASNNFPAIELYPNDLSKAIDVDLVLDIGNSNTFGVLFEHPTEGKKFEFANVEELVIRDLSKPEKYYDDPFSMRLVFHKCSFGEFGEAVFRSLRFQWPSFIRIGNEANRLIYKSDNVLGMGDKESLTNYSSPKRYLWDDESSTLQWELIKTNEDEHADRSIWLYGISEQFNGDGSFKTKTGIPLTNNYSRRSLMTFVFIEILSHALCQINSHEFRQNHGNSTTARRLRRIVITCPTGMILEEQIRLREAAEEASIALSRYYNKSYDFDYDGNVESFKTEVIPSVKELRRTNQAYSVRKDWMYDEATCNQLVFIYSELSVRYLNDCARFFELYGKRRADLPNHGRKSVTIGSIDIGGGTTDVMICSYVYGDGGSAVVTPYPLYWESFNMAGDDLLKRVIQEVIIEGDITNSDFRGCTGVIQNHAIEKGITNVSEKMNSFFGFDAWNIMDFKRKQIRRAFNTQIAIPIAERYLEHAQLNKEDEICSFDNLFPINKPNREILDVFESHFEFKFEEIRWKLSTKRVQTIVERYFDPMIKQLSMVIHAMSCDFVLLAGRPTKFKIVGDLLLKYYPVSPDRIISLSDYWVGRWYPFQDGNGYFKKKDSKSLVAVGAAISLLGGRLDLLDNFRINLEYMKTQLSSTADYIGIYNKQLNRLDNAFLSPEINRETIEIHSLPLVFGFKRLAAGTYPSRPIYLIDLNRTEIVKWLIDRHDTDASDIRELCESYIVSLKNRMPFKVVIAREYHDNKELLKIESVEDRDGNLVSNKFIRIKTKTIVEDEGYWLDSGEFLLRVQTRK